MSQFSVYGEVGIDIFWIWPNARGVAECARKHKHQDGTKHVTRALNVFIRSLGDEEHMDLVERVVAECRQEDTEYELSYGFDESEWSLNTSQMWRLGARFPEFVGRSVREMFQF